MKTLYLAALSLTFLFALPSSAQATGNDRVNSRRTQNIAPGEIWKRVTQEKVKERNVRAEMEFLASDAMQGRGSGTQFELVAGTYIASQLRGFGIEPAGDRDSSGHPGYIQTVSMVKQSFASSPVLSMGAARWTHGKEVAVAWAIGLWKAPLQKLKEGAAVAPGAAVFVHLAPGKGSPPARAQIGALLQKGATAILVADSPEVRKLFSVAASKLPLLPMIDKDHAPISMAAGSNVVLLGAEATAQVESAADGTEVALTGNLQESPSNTWNVIGVLRGTGATSSSGEEAVLLGAHMDHLGVDANLKGDQIYNGADDDASGTIAVLELGRILGGAPRPKRTVYFVLFGSEEKGGLGAQYFLDHSPGPIEKIVADVEFEMIGRPDGKVPAQTLWLTGYERSNLGSELAAHGAHLVADPHPEENFFSRSDNFPLAKRGVVAHTVSSFGLHKDYHQPSDDITHIDFAHLTKSIDSMVKPILWLANSDFVPKWNPGKKP